ncbi:MAG: transglycosylase domain-containing protein, partial [Candidatus Levyibacteriota bacterium]
QKIVLGEIVQDGYITQDQADAAENETLQYNPNKTQTTEFTAPHFATYVRDQLIKQYGEERVIRDGFQVTTTLDRNLQQFAQNSVKTQVTRLKYNHASNGAAVAIDPKNGQILAMVGSYNWDDPSYGQTNMAVTPRQPGSSFKPIIYGRALEDKQITAATVLQDVATTFDGGYKPLDYDKRFRGDVTVRRALANSLNIPAVEVMQKVGDPNGLDQARKMGITTLSNTTNYGLSLVLGTGEVPLLQMTDAYATFADEGVYHLTTPILSIKDKDSQTVSTPTNWVTAVLSFFNPQTWFMSAGSNGATEAMSKEAAFIISSILSDNNARAEEFGSAMTINRPAAVKTGTTEDFRDALTIGYTPSLVVGVWVGNNDNTPMDDIAGSLGAAPIWRNVMEYQLMGTPVEHFDIPSFIVSETVCPTNTYRSYTEYFIDGTQPDSCGQPTTYPTFTPEPTNNAGTPTTQPTVTPTSVQQLPTTTPFAAPTTAATPTSIVPTVKIP